MSGAPVTVDQGWRLATAVLELAGHLDSAVWLTGTWAESSGTHPTKHLVALGPDPDGVVSRRVVPASRPSVQVSSLMHIDGMTILLLPSSTACRRR
jgi:hypothetical protein